MAEILADLRELGIAEEPFRGQWRFTAEGRRKYGFMAAAKWADDVKPLDTNASARKEAA